MFDQADLDFGIYRIINARREEVTRFLNDDLLPQVKLILQATSADDQLATQSQLNQLVVRLRDDGVDPESSTKYKELRERLNALDTTDLQNEIFSHLYTFFSRYYDSGDFISKRRYKENVYAIPYEGEEVKLYWANSDQYYIKTSEYFRDYTFVLEDSRRVHFKLAEADTELNNNKAAADKERRFILRDTDPVTFADGEMMAWFEYRSDPDKRKQKELNTLAAERILACCANTDWVGALAAKATNRADETRTVLDKHLRDYSARNTFDYFIHKDLGGFLRRELDFFIKAEVVRLDDLENLADADVLRFKRKIKALRWVGEHIIDFLAQLENFQKALWLKKKFVVETHYCATLDRVPEALYAQIAANDAQREEWVKLFAIDALVAAPASESTEASQPALIGEPPKPAYSVPLSVEFLKANPSLVVDTRFFDETFKNVVLASWDNLDDQLDGLLIHSENFQAIRLLNRKYANQVDCAYIDPPYNTEKDRQEGKFLYKDNYTHSSWLSLMNDRVIASRSLLSPKGVIFVSIDREEVDRLRILLQSVFGEQNSVGELVWRNARDNNPTQVAIEHEYILAFANELAEANPVWKNTFSDAKELLLGEYERLKGLGLTTDAIQTALRAYIRDNENVLTEVDRYKFVDEQGVYTGSQSVHNPHPGGYVYDVIHKETGKPMRMPANGYRFPYETFKREYVDQGRLIYGSDENRIVQIKLYLKDYSDSLRSVVDLDGRLGSYALTNLFGSGTSVFDNPKPPQLLTRLLSFSSAPQTIVLDFFAGSGSSAQAVFQVMRSSGVHMKFVMVEMGNYFDTVLKPRIQKVIYSHDWRDGKPISRQGSSHAFKYMRLESYEDALNNIELKRSPEQANIFNTLAEQKQSPGQAGFRMRYLLNNMLEVESRGSASLLNLAAFDDPFHYTLNISSGTVGESRPAVIDLVETFNYLLGLRVRSVKCVDGVKVVQGTLPEGSNALILWRTVGEVNNEALDTFFRDQGYTDASDFDVVYVNGDNTLENLRRPEQLWKVRLIEAEFKRLMFEETNP
jgi:adenine-specific DNA-methyltransferase